ncbi:hypothetical protein J4H86_09250 [Spiractinospora alimapuensis]|uniref:hypothetical protein n=1 Tax=Spiractinospora alimapuensis TaxID=2820884 RepID=UPI001F2D09EC|nr:hypothetical protein [Spiractinospora alimapuensis]QVQ53873.1 hypothetical protein J4H86_09250 [Spiractinospora alimapuensis]
MAETFTDVVSRFRTVTEELADALDGPFIEDRVAFKQAYEEFGATYVDKMRDVQEHGSRLSGNVQAGAIEVSRTDSDSAQDYWNPEQGRPVPETEWRPSEEHYDYVQRQINESIDERYVPDGQ